MENFMQYMLTDNVIAAAIILMFCIYIYWKFCKQPKPKIVKAPAAKEIKKAKKRSRKIKKIKRKFRLPYRGKTQIEEFDPYHEYIESIWDEIEHK